MSLVSLEDVSLSFADRRIFDGVSFAISPGEHWVLVGRSGSGKTSLLDLLHGKLKPDGGRIQTVRGLRVGHMRQAPEVAEGASVYAWALSGRTDLIELRRKIDRLRDDADSGDPRLVASLAELEANYAQEGGPDLERRAAQTLEAVGFPASTYDMQCNLLSGGERSRLDLARILIMEPDLLLLDEPTLHLDIQGIEFLEHFLASFEGAAVVASNDRAFAEFFASGRLEIGRDGGVSSHPGAPAPVVRGPRDDGDAGAALPYLEVEHSGKVVFFVKQVTLRPGDQVLLQDGSFMVNRGERLGVIGPVGCGKSTLLRALSGAERPERGQMGSGFNAQVGIFDPAVSALTTGRTVLDELRAIRSDLDRPALQEVAAHFLFPGDEADRRVESLSDGERSRLALALLILGPHNVLLLDEPTRLLDLPSRVVVEEALADYPGTLVVVSQDRRFLDRVAERILSFEGRDLVDETGRFSELRKKGRIMHDVPLSPRIKGQKKKRAPAGDEDLPAAGDAAAPIARADIEARIAEQGQTIEDLQLKMADPAMALDWEGLEKMSAKKKEVEADLASLRAKLKRLDGD